MPVDKKLAPIGAIAMVPKSFPLYITLYVLSPKLSRDTDFRGHSVFAFRVYTPNLLALITMCVSITL